MISLMEKHKIDKDFAEKLVRLRLALPLRNLKPVKIKEVAEGAGVNVNSYSTAENGVVPGEKVLIRIARYFKVSEDYLLGKEKKGAMPEGRLPTPISIEDIPPAQVKSSLEPEMAIRMAPLKAVQSLTAILQSGNSTIIRAILSNLEAFGGAIEQQAQDKARITALEEECADLRSRMSNLEEKMSLILAGQTQKKTGTNA